MNFIGSLPESLTQGLLIGKLLVGGLGVKHDTHPDTKCCQTAGNGHILQYGIKLNYTLTNITSLLESKPCEDQRPEGGS